MPDVHHPFIARMISRRARHHTISRHVAADIERHARQLTLEVARDNQAAATSLLLELLGYASRLQGELAVIKAVDEVMPEAKRTMRAA